MGLHSSITPYRPAPLSPKSRNAQALDSKPPQKEFPSKSQGAGRSPPAASPHGSCEAETDPKAPGPELFGQTQEQPRNYKGTLLGLKGLVRDPNPEKGNKGLLWVCKAVSALCCLHALDQSHLQRYTDGLRGQVGCQRAISRVSGLGFRVRVCRV